MNIEDLPVRILKKIFLNVPDRRNLRLVSRSFKNIVNKSPKLMEKYRLNVSKCCMGKCEVNAHYQCLKFTGLGLEVFQFINNYQHKKRIRSVQLYPKDGEIERFPMTVQQILFAFDNLTEIKILIWGPSSFKSNSQNAIKFSANRNSNLTTLRVDSIGSDRSHVSRFFDT
jgi:hypothetical protein